MAERSRSNQERQVKHGLHRAFRQNKIPENISHNVMLCDVVRDVPQQVKIRKNDEDLKKFAQMILNRYHPCSLQELMSKMPSFVYPVKFECDYLNESMTKFFELDDIFHQDTIGKNGVKNLAATIAREYVKKNVLEANKKQFYIIDAYGRSANEIEEDFIVKLNV